MSSLLLRVSPKTSEGPHLPFSRLSGPLSGLPSDLGTILGTVLDDNYRLQLGQIDTMPEYLVTNEEQISQEPEPKASPAIPKPETPQGFTTTVCDDETILLRWNPVDRAVSYRLECLAPLAMSWETIFNGRGRKFRHSKLAASATYSYRLLAVSCDGESDYALASAWTTAKPAAASGAELIVTATGPDSVSVACWTGFEERRCTGIEWSTDGRNWNSHASENGETSFTINGLEQDTEYVIRTEILDENGSSSYSETVSTRTNRVVPPSVPTTLSASGMNHGTVKLTWTVSDSTTRTFVQRAPSPNGPWTTVLDEPTEGKTALFWIDAVSTTQTLCFYRFRAANSLGDSTWTGPVTVLLLH